MQASMSTIHEVNEQKDSAAHTKTQAAQRIRSVGHTCIGEGYHASRGVIAQTARVGDARINVTRCRVANLSVAERATGHTHALAWAQNGARAHLPSAVTRFGAIRPGSPCCGQAVNRGGKNTRAILCQRERRAGRGIALRVFSNQLKRNEGRPMLGRSQCAC